MRAVVFLWLLPSTTRAGTRQMAPAQKLPAVVGVEAQPLLSQVGRLRDAMDVLGEPLPQSARKLLKAAESAPDDARAALLVQQALDPLCLAAFRVARNHGTSVVVNGTIPPLVEQGLRALLIKVVNESGASVPSRVKSPNALPIAE